MAAPVKYNNAFFEDLSRSQKVSELCRGVAERLAAIARSTAPTASRAYRNGIVVIRKYQKRVVWVVVASDRKSLIIESKTGNLVRALNSLKRSPRA